jgi:serine/threonine protein kinase
MREDAVAPEIITGRMYTHTVDMWSAGVILFILLSGVVPFEDPDEQKVRTRSVTCASRCCQQPALVRADAPHARASCS